MDEKISDTVKKCVLNAYKGYITGSKDKKGNTSNWYGSKDQKAPNIMIDGLVKIFEKKCITSSSLDIRTNNSGGEYEQETSIGGYKKKIDITFVDKKENNANPTAVLGVTFKMPLSSVNKNLKNMVEAIVGETAIIKDTGLPYCFICITDETPIKLDHGLFDSETLSETGLRTVEELFLIEKTSPLRPNLILALKVDFGDAAFKKENKGRNFKTQEDKQKIGEEHLNRLGSDFSKLKLSILKINNQRAAWEESTDDLLEKFFELIKAKITEKINNRLYF